MNYQFFCKEIHTELFSDYLKNDDRIITVAIKNRFQQLYFYEFSLHKYLLKNNTDIFLATHYITPKANNAYKIISIFHDMGFILHPDYYPKIKQIYFSRQIPTFIKRADKIITVSNSTLNDLTKHFPESSEKSLCIYPGTDHIKRKPSANKSASTPPFILAVNSFEKRKNIPFILEIFSMLKTKYNIPHQLYLVGQQNNHSTHLKNLISNLKLKNSVQIYANVTNEDLHKFYNDAQFFISTSQYEGFGFTPFEAIKSGLPAFLFKNAVCEEFFGNHEYVIENTDPDVWADLIFEKMNKGFPKALNQSIFEELTWSNTSKSFLDLFKGM